jgi:hypothetical protein
MEEWFYVKNDLKAREDIKENHYATHLVPLRPLKAEGRN